MRLLLRWWNHPADYAWTVSYSRTEPMLRHARIAVGTWCLLYSVLCLLATHTPAGVPDGIARVSALCLVGTAAVIGVLWVRGPWPSERVSRVFVVYLELSAAAALLILADPFVALPAAAALGVNGSYIAAFHSPKIFLGHQVWAAAVVGVLFVRAVTAPDPDVVLACAYLVLLALTLFSAPVLTHALLLLLRRDSAAAFYDPLTGVRNRRGLDAAVADLGDTTGPATVMVIDLDNFKQVNDRFGHSHGDVVLRNTASAIDSVFPSPSITARTGGEEFVVLTHIDPADAVESARRLQGRFAAHAGAGATVSIGIAFSGEVRLRSKFQSTVDRADAAMYTAKNNGGNTVHIDGPEKSPRRGPGGS